MQTFKQWLANENLQNQMRYLGSGLAAGPYADRVNSMRSWRNFTNQPVKIPREYLDNPSLFLRDALGNRSVDEWIKIAEIQVRLWTQAENAAQASVWQRALRDYRTNQAQNVQNATQPYHMDAGLF